MLFSTVDEVYFGLNAVASRVWELLPPALGTVDDLCTTLAREHPDVAPETIRSDVAELLEHLIANALVVPAPLPSYQVNAPGIGAFEAAPAASY